MQNTIKIPEHGNTRFIAHRGVSGLETENTAAAFIAAGNRSYYGIETDIWRTKDGRFICSHDGKTGRICEEDWNIELTPFQKLRSLTLKDTLDGTADRSDLKLCTPAEYRKICEHYGKHCIAELKSSFTRNEILQIIQIFLGYLDHTTFISFEIRNLDYVREIVPGQSCQWLTSEYNDQTIPLLTERKMDVDIYEKCLNEERIALFHQAGILVNTWTVDRADRAKELISWKTDQLTSNILE